MADEWPDGPIRIPDRPCTGCATDPDLGRWRGYAECPALPPPAVCLRFYDTTGTWQLRMTELLWGLITIELPQERNPVR